MKLNRLSARRLYKTAHLDELHRKKASLNNNDAFHLERVPVMLSHFSGVMAGLVPAIHALLADTRQENVDARDKRGHDGGEVVRFHRNVL